VQLGMRSSSSGATRVRDLVVSRVAEP